MSELKPCPFCDEQNTVVRLKQDGKPTGKVGHACFVLGIEIRTSEKQWNTRAERTCVPIRRNGDRFEHDDEDTSLDAVCSLCRSYLGEAKDVFSGRTAFCSTCGARIEREGS